MTRPHSGLEAAVFGCPDIPEWALYSFGHPDWARLYQNEYRLVIIHSRGEFIVLSHRKIGMLEQWPDIPLSHSILLLALASQHRFLDWRLTPYGKELFKLVRNEPDRGEVAPDQYARWRPARYIGIMHGHSKSFTYWRFPSWRFPSEVISEWIQTCDSVHSW